MSRPIAYNLPGAAINGSITNEDAVISYVVDGRGNDYFNNYESCTWVPSADGAAPIVFVTDTFTRGYEANPNLAVPLFFACAGTSSAAIIYTANRLPGSPGNYTNANTAIEDLNKTLGYFILESNDPFQGINATNLSLSVDASKMTSYPQTANNWYDLSGTGNTISLTNGPAWSSSGWFTFDGTDDYGVNSSPSLNITGNVTMNAWIRNNGAGSAVGNYMSKAQNNGYRMRRNGGSGSPFWLYSFGNNVFGGAINDNIWYMVTGVFSSTGLRAYINSTLVASNSTPYSPSSLTLDSLYIGAYTVGAELFGGDIQGAQVYASALTEAQIKQNYFGAPIVTDGLVFAVDANNIVSYPKSGTSAYNLTGSGTTGTLTNGPTFKLPQGGYWSFDGTDDYLAFGDIADLGTGDFTLSVWVYIPSGTANTFRAILNKKGPSGADAGYGIYYNTGMQKFLWSTANGSSASEIFTSNTFASIENTWANVVMVRQNGATNNGSYYVNGAYQSLASAATVLNVDSSYNLSLATAAGPYTPYCFQGDIANAKIYNKALTASEVLQNYQSEQYRFETPAGPVTNGLQLYYDFGNLDSYPSTGTTVYDLSGNSNNGTLTNSPGWNSTNGGTIIWDGVDDYIDTGKTATQLGFYNANYTIEAWVYPTSITSDRTMFGTDQGAIRQGLHLVFRGGNIYQGHFGSDFQAGTVTTNNWYQIVYTYNASTGACEIFKNSVSQGTGTIGSFIGTTNILIARWLSAYYFEGPGGIYRIYNRVLTSTEVLQNYNAQKTRFGL